MWHNYIAIILVFLKNIIFFNYQTHLTFSRNRRKEVTNVLQVEPGARLV